MTDYEYIVQQVKRAHYSGWDDEVLTRRTSARLARRKSLQMCDGFRIFALKKL